MSLLARGLRMVAIVGALWLLVVVLAWILQERMIYLPDRSAPAPPGTGAAIEEVVITTADGLELDAWYVDRSEPVTTVVLANGNAGNRGHRLPLAQQLHARGHAVLMLDYRGYGGNPGRPDEQGVVTDVRAGVEWLVAERGVPLERTAYLGESLGSAVAAAVATRHPPAAVVLRSPFPELAAVARRHYPFLPIRTLLRERHPTVEHLSGYEGPVLVVAGSRDRIVASGLSREVANALGAGYLEIAGAGHNDRALFDGADYLDAVDAFLRDAVGAPSG